MKKFILIAALMCSAAMATDVADNASERTPPDTVTGVTNDSGKMVGLWDFFVWLTGKDKPKQDTAKK